MMKKRVGLLMFLVTFFIANNASALEGWELSLYVQAGNAESRVAIGQQPDATSDFDNGLDVPAMLSGDLQVWAGDSGQPLWRDIRSGEATEWEVTVQAKEGQEVRVSWQDMDLPETTIELYDSVDNVRVDMHEKSWYGFFAKDGRTLMIQTAGE